MIEVDSLPQSGSGPRAGMLLRRSLHSALRSWVSSLKFLGGTGRHPTLRLLPKSIAARVAMLAWSISILNLIAFVAVTVPQQQRDLQQHLESKARGIVAALRDASTSHAINEDLSEIVFASQAIISGDPDLDFLVFNKNDGYSLISQRSGWSVKASSDPEWRQADRIASSIIRDIQSLGLRSFHYAHPLDYSGLEWGWIHVGISLQSYDAAVKTLYLKTTLLGIGCALLSLIASVFYAKKMVDPIMQLRRVVQCISAGDLEVRADIDGQDEIAGLGHAVNQMTQALDQRNKQLLGATHAIQVLHSERSLIDGIGRALKAVVMKTGQRRAIFARIDSIGRHLPLAIKQVDYVNPELAWQASKYSSSFPIRSNVYSWLRHVGAAAGTSDRVETLPDTLSRLHQKYFPRDAISPPNTTLALPVYVEGNLYGFVEAENESPGHQWSGNEFAVFMSIASSIGTEIARHFSEQAVWAAKSELENRVRERTQELEQEVAAKALALKELADTQNTLMQISRSAGMAEVATGVLHNVGNVLNSVNVSSNLIIEQLRASRTHNLLKVANMLNEHREVLPDFLTSDHRGRQIITYLTMLGDELERERMVILDEAKALHQRIEHIKEIISVQQMHGRTLGLNQELSPRQLMDDALKMSAEAMIRHGVKIQREYSDVPNVIADKHKILQILLNLITNAKQACSQVPASSRLITLRIAMHDDSSVRMDVIDSGVGIDPANLSRIFQHGFTTRRDGHGFGLHSGALAARLLGGALTVHSDGLGTGATFSLIIPLKFEPRQEHSDAPRV